MKAALILLLLVIPAAADIWQDCETLQEFCSYRFMHRDCKRGDAVRCVCVEHRDADGGWWGKSCGFTANIDLPDLNIEYGPPVPCLMQGAEACR